MKIVYGILIAIVAASLVLVFNVQKAKGSWVGLSDVICELDWTANLSLVPEYIRNDPNFTLSYEGNNTTIQL
jgi:hypothetical protein